MALVDDPFTGDILKLEAMKNRWRRRAGNCRIFLAVDTAQRAVNVRAIVRRTSTTYSVLEARPRLYPEAASVVNTAPLKIFP